MVIQLKTPAQIATLRRVGQLQAEILNTLGAAVRPGVSTLELDLLAEKLCAEKKVQPAFKNYQGFPAALCTSINDEVVHGIPCADRILNSGDILKLDFGLILDGWHADACCTFLVGEVALPARQLVERTRKSLFRGIEQARSGQHVGDIGHAIESFVQQFGYSPVRETVGHGIGRALHEAPEVPNWGTPGSGAKLSAGMVICIEPIINAGAAEILTAADGWTTRTKDGELSAHFEHQILVTDSEPEILTPWDTI